MKNRWGGCARCALILECTSVTSTSAELRYRGRYFSQLRMVMCQTKDRQDPLSKGNPINTFHPPGGAQEYLTAVSGSSAKSASCSTLRYASPFLFGNTRSCEKAGPVDRPACVAHSDSARRRGGSSGLFRSARPSRVYLHSAPMVASRTTMHPSQGP